MHFHNHLLTIAVSLFVAAAIIAVARACEDEHPPAVTTPVERFSLRGAHGQPALTVAFDPRGLRSLEWPADESGDPALWTQPDDEDVWHYREWQWWRGHPWGDSCRPRYWTKAKLSTRIGKARAAVLDYRIDGFDCRQSFLMPDVVAKDAVHWDVVIRVRNVSGGRVQEYGQFFACYTPLNRGKSFWFWDAAGELVLFADRNVRHLDGYVVHPQAYFLPGGAIPHCPRGGGKVVGTWRRPVMVSHASPAGWRSIIMLEEKHACSLAHGIEGRAMDYVIFPGPKQENFDDGAEFSVHIRHYLLKSPELPGPDQLEKLWSQFEQAHPSTHRIAQHL